MKDDFGGGTFFPKGSNLIGGLVLALDWIRLEIRDESAILKSRSQKGTNGIDLDQCGSSSLGL